MKKHIKSALYKILGLRLYLRLLYRSLAFLLDGGFLKRNPTFHLHYFSQKIIAKGDTVLDIGANLGYYTRLFLKAAGEEGQVYAVEPVLPFYENIRYFLGKHKNLTVYNNALGEKNTTIQLTVPNRYGYIRTGLPSIYEGKETSKEGYKFFTSQMVKGSELFADISTLDYLKMDVEGYERVIIPEIKEFLKRTLPCVQIEIGKENIEPIRSLFFELGYNIYFYKNQHLTSISPVNYSQDYFFIHPEKKEKYKNLMIH